MNVYCRKQRGELLSFAQHQLSLSRSAVFENFAHDCALVATSLWTHTRRFVVICGPHAKGLMGIRVARQLACCGSRVQIICPCPIHHDSLKNVPAFSTALQQAAQCHISVAEITDPHACNNLLSPLYNTASSVVIDALLDDEQTFVSNPTCSTNAPVFTGHNAANMQANMQQWLAHLRNLQPTLLALDTPSGIHPDSGANDTNALQATASIAFFCAPIAMAVAPGAYFCGKRFVSSCGVPATWHNQHPGNLAFCRPSPLPLRTAWGHKNTFGNALVIGGSHRYQGAAAFCAMAALRAGCGYVRLACPAIISHSTAILAPEIVLHAQSTTSEGSIDDQCSDELISLSNGSTFVVIGPGLSLHPSTCQLVRNVVQHCSRPMLIDGDGISAMCGYDSLIAQRTAPTIVTPHPGEMARWIGETPTNICSDPVRFARQTARELNCYVVLKVAPAIVACPDGSVSVNTTGNHAMATAGSGDILSGTICAVYCLYKQSPENHDLHGEQAKNNFAQKCEQLACNAAITGTYLHGLAGNLARDTVGADATTARDILNHLGPAVRSFRNNYDRLMNHIPPCRVPLI